RFLARSGADRVASFEGDAWSARRRLSRPNVPAIERGIPTRQIVRDGELHVERDRPLLDPDRRSQRRETPAGLEGVHVSTRTAGRARTSLRASQRGDPGEYDEHAQPVAA